MATQHNGIADIVRKVCSLADETSRAARGESPESIPGELRAQLETAFSPSSLSEAFKREDDLRNSSGREDPNIIVLDYKAAQDGFLPLEEHDELLQSITSIIKEKYKDLIRLTPSDQATSCPDPDNLTRLRALVTVVFCPAYSRPDQPWCRQIIVDLADTLIKISKLDSLFQILVKWFQEGKRLLRRVVSVIHGGFLGLRRSKAYHEIVTTFSYVDALAILNEINDNSGCLVPTSMFYVTDVGDKSTTFDMVSQYMHRFIKPETIPNIVQSPALSSRKFYWFDFPFLLDVQTKWTFISIETIMIQEVFAKIDNPEYMARMNFILDMAAIQTAYFYQTGHRLPRVLSTPRSTTYLVFNDVDRDNIVASAIDNVSRYWNQGPDIWMKPLQVNFGGGEYAVDKGGPSKEFFRLLFEALIDTSRLSIFRKLNDRTVSSAIWFNPDYHDHETLRKIGLLFALLLFNRSIVTVPFPVLLYEKILARTPFSSADLTQLDPGLIDEMRELRSYSEEELEHLSLDFSDLQPDGENVMVSKENLDVYIDLKGKRIFAKRQFESFVKGFDILFKRSKAMQVILRPEELRNIILGDTYDWKQFEKSTSYKKPYSPKHPVIRRFWKVFHALEEREKRKYLEFLTGAVHVPIKGFQSLRFTIRRLDTRKVYGAAPGEICPEVMTCPGYISMDLPEYKNEEDVRFRLMLALEIGKGFYREIPPSRGS